MPTKFSAIVDQDADDAETTRGVNRFAWNVYHIENYLLEPEIIAKALNSTGMTDTWDEPKVLNALNEAARNVVPAILVHKMRALANSKLIKCINLSFAPDVKNVGKAMYEAIQRSHQRFADVSTELTEASLSTIEKEIRVKVEQCLADGT